MNIVEIENLNFSYKDNLIFDNLNLNIKKNSFTTILGPNGSGKSTLAKLIIKKNKNIKIYTDNIYYVTTNPDNQIVGKTVKKQLEFYLKQIIIDKETIENKINEISEKFKLKPILNIDPYKLNNEYKQIIIILSIILVKPTLLIMDDALSFISTYNKNRIFKYLKKQDISIINLTNDSEECMYSNNIVIINKIVKLNKPLKKALKEEKTFLENHLKLPFIAELSLKLNYYNLLDDITLNIDEMVDKIWN